MFSGCFRFPGLWCVALGASLGATLAPLARADAPPPATLVADAVIPWHADLAAATQAALVSHRPALVVFLAGSSESGAALSRDVFPAAETVALLTACFEPVRVDVDIDPSAARALGITQVPTACIVDGQQRLLARFDCPTTPAAFVAAASRAAQEAATVRAAGAVTPAAAIREQSDFVKQAAQPALQPTAQPLVAAPAAAPPADTAHAEEPSLPMTPPAWPAEPATRPMPFMPDSQAAAPARSAIEPATTAPNAIASAPAAPWLTAPAAPVAPAAPAAVAASPATPVAPAAPPAAPPAAEPEKKSASSQFLAALQKPFTLFSKPKTDAAVTTPATPAPGSAVAATPQPAAAPDPYGSMPLGLEGYCPVSLIDKGTWVEGRAQWGARHRGRTYLFAGAEQQRAFLATPDRYAPALSGDDPVLACDTGKQVAGQRRFGVTYQSRTYLFSSPETRTAFAANPQRYTTRVVIAERPAASDSVVR